MDVMAVCYVRVDVDMFPPIAAYAIWRMQCPYECVLCSVGMQAPQQLPVTSGDT
jgi:hypothetical protein